MSKKSLVKSAADIMAERGSAHSIEHSVLLEISHLLGADYDPSLSPLENLKNPFTRSALVSGVIKFTGRMDDTQKLEEGYLISVAGLQSLLLRVEGSVAYWKDSLDGMLVRMERPIPNSLPHASLTKNELQELISNVPELTSSDGKLMGYWVVNSSLVLVE